MLLITTVNMLAISKRNARPRNKISRIKKSLETILIITVIFEALEEIFRIFPILPTQYSQNLHLLHKIQLFQQVHSLLLPRLLIQILYYTLFKTALSLLPTQNYKIIQFRESAVPLKALAKEISNSLLQQKTNLTLYYYMIPSTVPPLHSI